MPRNRTISIPSEFLPLDGRFGSGPSRIPVEAIASLAASGTRFLGTSHRQPTVQSVVGEIRRGLSDLYHLPEGFEVVLGVGGATAFWDVAAFGLIERRSAHFVCGEFSAKFANVTTGAPFLDDPVVISVDPPGAPNPMAVDGVDTVAFIHNETSTGVMAPYDRVGDELVLVDGTSAAGAVPIDIASIDAYYFSPQKAFASEGGLWGAIMSPAALDRAQRVAEFDRWIPPFLSMVAAMDNSRRNQTYNTPSLSTLFLLHRQIFSLLESGGLMRAFDQCTRSAAVVYGWAETHDLAAPFVQEPALRSPTIATIDLDGSVDASEVAAVMRANGVVDIESYRKLGRNQVRIAMFPAIPTEDLEKLTGALSYVIEALSS